ncbi:uncharacterized protein LOC120782149 [Bactrocera tryoni]|uniref:uncharacterized protein LOC120782149 n=1 Tax=Bactrocera tryoni TaxID=59916 RepID=UPI001A96F9FB|nr:uncharacterized protein LOC120782149 [Bactrocera tryoni]
MTHKFDVNRNMDNEQIEELQLIISQQEAIIDQQRLKLQELDNTVKTQAYHIQSQGATTAAMQDLVQQQYLSLNNRDKLQQFRHLKPLEGTSHLMQFTKSVERTLGLCSDDAAVQEFGLQIIIQEKICGDAAKCLREVRENATWEEIKKKLKEHLHPRTTYGEIYNKCRYIKTWKTRNMQLNKLHSTIPRNLGMLAS